MELVKLYCQKDNCYVEQVRGCLHPNDYCKFRSSCIIYYMEQEKQKKKKK